MLEKTPDVILLAYYFPPDSTIGAARPYRFYKHLKKAGRRCWVVTASQQPPNAPPDVLFVLDKKGRRVVAGEEKPPPRDAPRRALLPPLPHSRRHRDRVVDSRRPTVPRHHRTEPGAQIRGGLHLSAG